MKMFWYKLTDKIKTEYTRFRIFGFGRKQKKWHRHMAQLPIEEKLEWLVNHQMTVLTINLAKGIYNQGVVWGHPETYKNL